MNVKIRRTTVKGNAALSVVKQLFSIAFPMITFPYVTRILGAENYGKYTFSASIVNYISYIGAAGILRYAIRECSRIREDKEKQEKLVNEIFTINICTTFVAYVVLFVLLLTVPMLHDYAKIILILSLSVLFTTLGTDWINNAYEDYFFITVRYIISQILAVLMLFLLVQNSNNLFEYACVSVFGGILANILNIVHIRRSIGLFPKLTFSAELVKHFKPIFFLFTCTIATFIYINSDVTILRIYSNDISVGYYGVSTQFYQLIKQLINAAFIVVIPRISNELAKDKSIVYERYNKIFELTVLLIIPCSFGLFMIRKQLILLFAGIDYIKADSSLAILSFALIPAMLANFFINIVMIPLNKEKQVMVATVISALINIILNFLWIPSYSENAAAFSTFLAECSMTCIAIYYCRKIKFVRVLKPICASTFGGMLIILVCTTVSRCIINNILCISLSIIISIIVYGIVVSIFYKNELGFEFKKYKRL